MKFKILASGKTLHRFTADGPEKAYEYLDKWVKENMGEFILPKSFLVVSESKTN